VMRDELPDGVSRLSITFNPSRGALSVTLPLLRLPTHGQALA